MLGILATACRLDCIPYISVYLFVVLGVHAIVLTPEVCTSLLPVNVISRHYTSLLSLQDMSGHEPTVMGIGSADLVGFRMDIAEKIWKVRRCEEESRREQGRRVRKRGWGGVVGGGYTLSCVFVVWWRCYSYSCSMHVKYTTTKM